MSAVERCGASWRTAVAGLVCAFVITLCCLAAVPQVAWADEAGDFEITATDGSSLVEGTDYAYANGVLTITTTVPVTVSMRSGVTSTGDCISIEPGEGATAYVTLNGVTINSSSSQAPLAVAVGGTLDLTLVGQNSIRTTYIASSGNNGPAALYVPKGAALVVSGEGSISCSSAVGAGIGGSGVSQSGTCDAGSITINSGTVTAQGGDWSAGIGGGHGGGDGGDVAITGGVVVARGGRDAAGIGGAGYHGNDMGNGGALTVSGGCIMAARGSKVSGGSAKDIGPGNTRSDGTSGSDTKATITGGAFAVGSEADSTVYGLPVFSGCKVVEGSDSTYKYVVQSPLSLSASGSSFTYGDTVILTATYSALSGETVEGKTIVFKSGNVVLGTAEMDDQGVAQVVYDTTDKGIAVGGVDNPSTVTAYLSNDGTETSLSALSASTTIVIEKKVVTPSLSGDASKVYDGTTEVLAAGEGEASGATNTLAISLNDVLDVDKDLLSATATYEFMRTNASINRGIKATDISLIDSEGVDSKDSVVDFYVLSTTSTQNPDKGTIDQRVAQLEWSNVEGRVAGDGKEVSATVANLVAGDDVRVVLEGAAATEPGWYIAVATGLVGADAANYQLPNDGSYACSYEIAPAPSGSVDDPDEPSTGGSDATPKDDDSQLDDGSSANANADAASDASALPDTSDRSAWVVLALLALIGVSSAVLCAGRLRRG